MPWNIIVIYVFIAKFKLYRVTKANSVIAHSIPSTCQWIGSYRFVADLFNTVFSGTECVVLNNDADDDLESIL